MKVFRLQAFLLLLPALSALGCANETPSADKPQDKEAKIKAALKKLDGDDRTLAEEQKYCPVQTDQRLGSMGKPVKVMLKEDQSVFLCCESCEKAAKKNPEQTLARVEEMKVRAALEQLDPADRKLAEEQRFCATDPESRLGLMGKPIKVMIADQPVFLCCAGCEKAAKKDPAKTLATVEKLKTDSAKRKEE